MKIAIFSAYDCYGAGGMAYRLHSEFCSIGHDSKMYVCFPTKSDSVFIKHQEYRFLNDIWDNSSNIFSSMHFGVYNEQIKEAVCTCDVVNIHWVSNFISLDNIQYIRSLGKPIVITMHDENLYTGGCHYTGECLRYLENCRKCPQNALDISEAILRSKLKKLPSDITIVTPSKWLAEKAKKSKVLANNIIETINNGINLNIFKPDKTIALRKKYSFDSTDFIVLFGCQSLEDERKGIKYLYEAQEILNQDVDAKNIKFVCFGKADIAAPESIIHFGYVGDERALAELYSIADVLVVPSLEDNFPNTILESISCDTPVVAFNVGGIPEMVISGKTGELVEAKNSVMLAQQILLIKKNKALYTECRNDAERRYNISLCADEYLKLFSALKGTQPKPYFYDNFLKKALDSEHNEHKFRCEEIEKLANWLEIERVYVRLYEYVYNKIFEKFKTHSIILYGFGAWGRHIYSVANTAIDYIADKNKIEDDKYISPDSFIDLNKNSNKNIFVVVSVMDDADLIPKLDKMGVEYIKISDFKEEIEKWKKS